MKPSFARRIGRAPRALALLLAASLAVVAARAEDFYYYKVTVSLPVVRFILVKGKPKLETRTLKNKDIINIALGAPLGTNVGKKILAVRSPEIVDNPGAPASKLVIYDLDSKTVVPPDLAEVAALDYDFFQPGSKGSMSGFGRASFADTGASTTAKFYAATLRGAAKGNGSANPFDFNPKIAAATTTVNGQLKFDFTDAKGNFVAFEGFVLAGKVSASGKTLAIVDE